MSNKWKDFLLKSSLPLEYEVRSFLKDNDFSAEFEFSYLRADEHNVINEFSYDINAIKYGGGGGKGEYGHYFELMIECKYRDQSTKWLFIPHGYGEDEEHYLTPTGFMNFNDVFTFGHGFAYEGLIEELFPAVAKGIEINSNGQNPKTITQAIKQLSYAVVKKILAGIEGQINYTDMEDVVVVHIPIIVTTAKLFRLRENCTINDIKQAQDFMEIVTEEKCMLLKNFVGEDLKKYNENLIKIFIKNNEDKLAKRFNPKRFGSEKPDIESSLLSLAKDRPTAILVIHHDETREGYKQLLQEIEEILTPTIVTKKRLKKAEKRQRDILNAFEKMGGEKNKTAANRVDDLTSCR